MTDPDANTLIVACIAWADTTRREWMARNPNLECPIPSFRQMEPATRMTFMRIMRATLRAADPENVKKVIQRINIEGQ